jgi:hypothetical protein
MDAKKERRATLALTIKPDLISRGKAVAEAEHLSLSRLIERLLSDYVKQREKELRE